MLYLSKLIDVLLLYNWQNYEAKAYEALVSEGSKMKPLDVAIKSGIPKGRIYDVLSNLDTKKNCVRKTGKRPTYYEAIHPRQVLKLEESTFKSKSNEALKDFEEQWEFKRDKSFTNTESAWTVNGIGGIISEGLSLINQCKKCAFLIYNDLDWISIQDITRIKKLIDTGIEIKILCKNETLTNPLSKLKKYGIEIRMNKKILNPFIIVDGNKVLLTAKNPQSGVIMQDAYFANVLENQFYDYWNTATDIGDDEIVA